MPPFLGNISYENKLQIIGIFLQEHNSVKNFSIIPQIKLDLSKINLYNKFNFNMCNLCKGNEWKLLVDRLTDRRITAKKYFKNLKDWPTTV